jgi:hypothetical protein
MLIRNRIYNSFGPFESFAGKLIFIFGVISSFFSAYSSFLVMGGAFFGFTYFGTTIDTEKRRVRTGDVLFGIFKTGRWINIKPDMTLGVMKWNKVSQISSWSHQKISVPENSFLIVLFKSNGGKLLTLNKKESIGQANEELFSLSDLLNLRCINP